MRHTKSLLTTKAKLVKATPGVLLTLVAFGAYFLFTAYSPKALAELREVRGTRKNRLVVPYPKDAVQLSSSTVNKAQTILLKTGKPSRSAFEFYLSILQLDDWELVYQSETDGVYTAEFKSNDAKLVLSAESTMEEPQQTLVVIVVTTN